MAITKLYHGLLSGLNWPRCSRVALLRGFSTDCSYHNRIVERATACSKHTSHDDGVKYLSQFVDGGFDATRLRQFLPSDEGPSSSPLTIDDYLTILETCKLLKLHDMELVSTLSEDLRLAFVTLYKPKKRGRTRPPNAGDSSSRRLDSHIPKRPFQLDTSCAPPLKDVVLGTCYIYNDLHILYDPLFGTIGDLMLEHHEDVSLQEARTLLRTYASQNYRDHEFVDFLVTKVEANINKMDIITATSVYNSLSHLEMLCPESAATLEAVFSQHKQQDNRTCYIFDKSLSTQALIDIGYSKLIQQNVDSDVFWFIRDILYSVAMSNGPSITSQYIRKLTTLMAHLKCSAETCYSTLGDANIDRLNIICTNTSYKKFRTTKFTEKVSQHLEKLRIRHETNVYFNGILLDIMEKDRNLVWFCNSYHRFYAGSFEPTAESRTLDRLIRDFGFKTCHINYYQWGRLKARRTRFAYIRMARYYALHDHREYDHRYAGWSLPYLWWNASRQDQMHISNYIKYDP